MNTPLIKLKDKGYNCFSQRMTTIRQELGRPISVAEVTRAIIAAFERVFRISLRKDLPSEWEEKTARRLREERYNNKDWIFSHKHARARMGVGRVKSKGGLIEVYLSLSGSSIEHIMITGDFFSSDGAVHRLEGALKWTSSRKEIIEKNIASVWQDEMIYGLDMAMLAEAILKAKENAARL